MPASGTLTRFAWEIVIGASTGGIRVTCDGATETVSVAAGTYYWLGDGTAADFGEALRAALHSHSKAPTITVYLDPDGTIRIVSTLALSLLLADGATTLDETLLGCHAATYTASGSPLTITSPHQVAHLWVPERIYTDDSGAYPEHLLDRATSLSGRSGLYLWGSRSYRDILIDLLPASKLFAAEASDNEAFQLLHAWLASGGAVRWTPSVTAPATHYLVGIRDDEWLAKWPVERIDQVAGRYLIRFPLEML